MVWLEALRVCRIIGHDYLDLWAIGAVGPTSLATLPQQASELGYVHSSII
jgi:hypothetical protein